MGKILVIAEKPSVGRDIARVLGCGAKGDGCLFSEEYIISWAVGHLVTLCEPEDYDEKYKKWKLSTLPVIPDEIKLKPVENTKKQLTLLAKLMKSKEVDSLICATDSGREGELIFRYIYQISGCQKPFSRLWISSMTDAAVKEGFKNLRPGHEYDKLYQSAKCRSEADWLVGINATRAFTVKYNSLLSIGRVQTPTLALIVEKQKEIDDFVPKEYWEVMADFETYKGKWIDENSESKIEDGEKAQGIAAKVLGQSSLVKKVENEEKSQPPPLLYDLTELQRECNNKFGFSAEKTLEIAQELYEKRKLITYPRTDSRYLSGDMAPKLKGIVKKLSAAEHYQPYCQYLMGLPQLPITKRIIDDTKITDHHAIIPTEAHINLNNLSPDLFKVYDLVARRFMAVFYPHYIYSITKIFTEAAGETFLSKGTAVIQPGWTELNMDRDEEKPKGKGKAKKDDDEEENMKLPALQEGDASYVKAAEALRKKTKPPKPYTEASLLSAMENPGRFIENEELKEQMKESGLGTPATRAAIIERLIQVGYLVRKGKTLVPTEKAVKLIQIAPKELISPETTGKWEKGLSSISKGKMEPEKFMQSIQRYVRFLVDEAVKSQAVAVFPEDSSRQARRPLPALGQCPLCGKDGVRENSKSFYCSQWRNGCRFTIWKSATEDYGCKLSPSMVKELLKEGKVEKIHLTLPQTKEKALADLVLKPESPAKVEFVNLNRISPGDSEKPHPPAKQASEV